MHWKLKKSLNEGLKQEQEDFIGASNSPNLRVKTADWNPKSNKLLNFSTCQESKVQNEDYIIWEKNNKLKWEYFKGEPNCNVDYKAISNIALFFKYTFKFDEKIEVEVNANFKKSMSWVKKENSTSSLLNHEQGHFDIAEIFARKLRKELLTSRSDKLFLTVDAIYLKIKKELDIYQDLYDKETDLSRNKERQAEWNKIIAEELKQLEKYSKSKFKIKIKN